MDLKEKLRGFISESKQKLLLSPSNCDPDCLSASMSLAVPGCLADRTQWTDSDREVSQLTSDPIQEGEVLAGLTQEYYQHDWDSSTFWINTLGDEGVKDLDAIDKARKDLIKQLTTVSRRVFSLILSKQVDCAKQLDYIVKVERQLKLGLGTCQEARLGLSTAQRQFVESSLGILSSVRRRQQTLLLLKHLTEINKLNRTLERAELLSRGEEWAESISLYLECQKLAGKYQHFTAISQLSVKLSDSLVMTEELLDSALSRQCTDFNPDVYAKLQDAYEMLGKSQTATDQLLMHYTTATHNTSWQVVYGHVCLMQPDLARPPPYQELCGLIQSDSFLPCLTDLLRALWGIMLSYHTLFCWHRDRWRQQQQQEGGSGLTDQYTKNKLESGLMRIWQDVQSKVKQFVLGSDLSPFSIDSFLHFLDLIHKLITVGHEFVSIGGCEGVGPSLLQDSLVTQCSNYFSNYHSSRLEELATHLENETWQLVPVKQNFSFSLLAEFSHISILRSPSKCVGSVFRKYSESGTPFDLVNCDTDTEEDILQAGHNNLAWDSDSDEDISDELKKQLIEENNAGADSSGLTLLSSRQHRSSMRQSCSVARPPATGKLVSNTAIMLLRLIGRYSHMMTVLKPIAKDVWTGICQLFQYYLYSVHLFFAPDMEDHIQRQLYTDRSSSLLSHIYNTVVLHEVTDNDITKLVGCVRESRLSDLVTLNDEHCMYGLSETIIGMESVLFLSNQLHSLQSHYNHQLAGDQAVETFYQDCVNICNEFQVAIYIRAVKNCLHSENSLKLMGKVSWDLKDVVSQHSHYVDHMLDILEMFSKTITNMGQEIPISQTLHRVLWETAAFVCCQIFLDGFASAKKCSNEGRALMQLDLRQFMIKMEKLSGLKPVPHQQLVSNYIKAHYIPESELASWVEQHSEYSSSQLRALISATSNNNNKTKQKLNSLINDLSDKIRR